MTATEMEQGFFVFNTIKAAWSKVYGAKKVFWIILPFAILADLVSNGNLLKVGVVIALLNAVVRFLCGLALTYLGILRANVGTITFDRIWEIFKIDIIGKIIGLYILKALVICIVALPLIFLPNLLKTTPEENVTAIYQLLTAAGYLIGIFWAIYIFIRLFLADMIILTEKVNPWVAFKTSFRETKGHVLKLIGFSIMNALIFIASLIPVGLGLIWSLPYFYISLGEVYKTLHKPVTIIQ